MSYVPLDLVKSPWWLSCLVPDLQTILLRKLFKVLLDSAHDWYCNDNLRNHQLSKVKSPHSQIKYGIAIDNIDNYNVREWMIKCCRQGTFVSL